MNLFVGKTLVWGTIAFMPLPGYVTVLYYFGGMKIFRNHDIIRKQP